RSALTKFKEDPTCMALLMDGTAALGLDLSFVNHVFLMEPIWDRSMEEQVISRAHRMGATRPINVETLAMRGTIEEQMLQLLQVCVDHIVRSISLRNISSNLADKTYALFAGL
uniref:Helicase C-terminal domain-containing protein n=1 Tax=Aegilops tauschii subsp. strangulata TaxID=200361 RepID=A0A453GN27_AEGTS